MNVCRLWSSGQVSIPSLLLRDSFDKYNIAVWPFFFLSALWIYHSPFCQPTRFPQKICQSSSGSFIVGGGWFIFSCNRHSPCLWLWKTGLNMCRLCRRWSSLTSKMCVFFCHPSFSLSLSLSLQSPPSGSPPAQPTMSPIWSFLPSSLISSGPLCLQMNSLPVLSSCAFIMHALARQFVSEDWNRKAITEWRKAAWGKGQASLDVPPFCILFLFAPPTLWFQMLQIRWPPSLKFKFPFHEHSWIRSSSFAPRHSSEFLVQLFYFSVLEFDSYLQKFYRSLYFHFTCDLFSWLRSAVCVLFVTCIKPIYECEFKLSVKSAEAPTWRSISEALLCFVELCFLVPCWPHDLSLRFWHLGICFLKTYKTICVRGKVPRRPNRFWVLAPPRVRLGNCICELWVLKSRGD